MNTVEELHRYRMALEAIIAIKGTAIDVEMVKIATAALTYPSDS